LAYSFASSEDGPVNASPAPLVFSISQGDSPKHADLKGAARRAGLPEEFGAERSRAALRASRPRKMRCQIDLITICSPEGC
jgi:hypothetical protein